MKVAPGVQCGHNGRKSLYAVHGSSGTHEVNAYGGTSRPLSQTCTSAPAGPGLWNLRWPRRAGVVRATLSDPPFEAGGNMSDLRVRSVAVFLVAALFLAGAAARPFEAASPQIVCHSHVTPDGQIEP